MKLLNLRIILPLSFFLFISFIIYLADTADYNFAFRIVGHIPYGDKFMHGLLYGVMALLLNYGLNFKNLSSTEYHIHKSLKIGKVFKIKFVGLAVANSKILFWEDCLFLGFPTGFTRFPICLDRFF